MRYIEQERARLAEKRDNAEAEMKMYQRQLDRLDSRPPELQTWTFEWVHEGETYTHVVPAYNEADARKFFVEQRGDFFTAQTLSTATITEGIKS